jgi:superfamily II DNA/RNA helicase
LDALLSAAETSGGVVSLQQLQTLFSFRLDDFQAQAVEVLLQGKSVVVCAPTGGQGEAGAVWFDIMQYTTMQCIAAVALHRTMQRAERSMPGW